MTVLDLQALLAATPENLREGVNLFRGELLQALKEAADALAAIPVDDIAKGERDLWNLVTGRMRDLTRNVGDIADFLDAIADLREKNT